MQSCLSTAALEQKPSLSNLINISVFPEQIHILVRRSDVPETPLRAGIIIFPFKVWSGFSRGEKRKCHKTESPSCFQKASARLRECDGKFLCCSGGTGVNFLSLLQSI